MTLVDRFNYAWEKYVAPSKAVDSKESNLVSVDNYSPVLNKGGYAKLTPARRREIANESPLLTKGIRKKSLDSIRAWISLETLDGRGAPIEADAKAIRAFELRTNYKKKFYDAIVCAHVYGDGFLLIQFDKKDEGTKLSDPPVAGSEPRGVYLLNPEQIYRVKYLSEANRKKDLYHYVFNDTKRFGSKYIHPERIQHIKIDELPYSKMGLSKIDLLRYIIESKKHIDIAAGRILSWFSHGIVDIEQEGLEEPELKKILAVAKEHPSAWAHDETMKLEIKNPTSIDPKPFYDYVIMNIASALIMPSHVLTGIQTGRVTGSEIGFTDYYRDILDLQELQYTPPITSLYRRIIEARGREWKYAIKWNTVYVDELAEASIMEKRVTVAEKALNGSKGVGGFIDIEEARKIYNKGQIEIDPKKEIEQRILNPPVEDDDDDEDKKENVAKDNGETDNSLPPIPIANKELITNWKQMKKNEIDKLEEQIDARN